MIGKRAIPFIFIFLIGLGSSSLIAQEINIKGIITNESNKAILFANIVVKPSGKTYNTNNFGAFVLKALYGDTIQISAISYRNISIAVNFRDDTLLRIVMKRLKETPIPKRKFADRDSFAIKAAQTLKTDSLLNNYDRIKKWPGKKVEFTTTHLGSISNLPGSYEIPTNGCAITGVISSLWYEYSDRGKEMQKTLHLLDLYKQEVKANERLTINYIGEGLGCSEDVAKKILESCKLSNDFIIKANDYDLIEALKKCAAGL
jgi:hypothetical protein